LSSGELGEIIGLGTGQSAKAVQQTIEVAENLTEETVAEFAEQG